MNGKILSILPAYNEEVFTGNMVLHPLQHADHDIATVLKNVKVF